MPSALGEHNTKAHNVNLEHNANFKARPVNRKVLDSVGDLGVPRVEKRKTTVAKEFSFSSRPSSARAKPQPSEHEGRPLFSSFGKAAAPRSVKPVQVVPFKNGTKASTTATRKAEPKPTPQVVQPAPAPEPTVAPAAAPAVMEAPEPVDVSEPEPAAPVIEATAVVEPSTTTSAEPEPEAPEEPEEPEPEEPAAAPASALTLAQLEAVQAEFFAEDVPIDLETMSSWTMEQARAFFESGGETAPAALAPAEAPEPASPALHLIKAEEPDTPNTVEF